MVTIVRSYKRLVGIAAVLLCTLAMPVGASAARKRQSDADLVVVLPATSRGDAHQMRRLLRPWKRRVRSQYRETSRILNPGERSRFKLAYVSLSAVTPAGPALVPEDLRQYLRARFTSRPTTTEHPRYLAIAALPYIDYGGAADQVQLPVVPRFEVTVPGVPPPTSDVSTDVPYGFIEPESIDGGDGFVDPVDLDMGRATFTVFRIPIAEINDLQHFVERANAFADAPSHRDVALVSGEFGLIPGDTSQIQCINAAQLASLEGVGQIFTVLDYPACALDFLTTGPGQRLADFLASPTSGFAGGVIYDVSHGNGDGIYAVNSSTGSLFVNLESDDLDGLPSGLLNVFISLSCDNDETLARRNFAMNMYLHDSVAVVSATESIWATSVQAILDAEINGFVALYQAPLTLQQGLHRFRSGYYTNYVLGGPESDRPYNWINLLAVHVLGDGLTIVSQ